jgi:DNA-binding transcriptional MerR regulator
MTKEKTIVKSTYKYRFHTLRHTYATYLLDKGVPLENIQKALGHQDLDTTLVYDRVSDTKTAQFVDDAFSSPLSVVKKNSLLNQHQPRQVQNTYNTANVLAVKSSETAIEILQKRLATGEINQIEFNTLTRLIKE